MFQFLNRLSFRLRIFAIALFFSFLLALTFIEIFYFNEKASSEAQFKSIALLQLNNKTKALEQMISSLKSHLDSLETSPFTEEFLKTPNRQNRERLETLFIQNVTANRDFMQLRFIDANGHESVRCDRVRDGTISLVKKSDLQDKSHRYYTQETASLESGRYYVSNLDLNIEHKQIVQPLEPTLRLAKPLYHNGSYAGFLIINYNIRNIISSLVESTHFNVFMTDSSGYYLFHHDKVKAWSAIYRSGAQFKNDYPDAIRPSGTPYIDENLHLYGKSITLGANRLILFVELKHEYIHHTYKKIYSLSFVIALIILIIVTLFSWFVAYISERLETVIDRKEHEITEHLKNLESLNLELKEQKEAFETLFEKSSDGLLILDEGKFVQCNETIVEMLGCHSKEALLDMHPSAISPEFQPDGLDSFTKAEAMIHIAKERGGNSFEWIHKRADGETFWADVSLTPIRMNDREIIHAVVRDISPRKALEEQLNHYTWELEQQLGELGKANKELLRQEEFLNRSQKIAHIGVWENVPGDERLYWSDEVFRIFGLEPQQITPTYQRFIDAVHPDDRINVESEYTDSVDQRREYVIQHRIYRPDGSLRHVEERGSHEFDHDDRLIRTVGIVLDITERKELETLLLAANRDLDQRVREAIEKNRIQEHHLMHQSRLAQMGELISMIAHQWRQPLSTIASIVVNLKIRTELTELDKSEDRELRTLNELYMQKLQTVEETVQMLTQIIDDFRNFYKPNKSAVATSFQQVCDKALRIIKPDIDQSKVQLTTLYDDHETIHLYENEMIQVVLNLLKNAQEHLVGAGIREPHITISTSQTGIRVCDNGGGIPEEILDRIFEPYFSTKEDKNGTGLGLYMSKIIVEEHHRGRFMVENVSSGACFEIYVDPNEGYAS
jgi:PAS domain S-box-containing protein